MSDMDNLLTLVSEAFRAAPAWTDPNVKVRLHYRQVEKKPVAHKPRTKLPPDAFSGHCAPDAGLAEVLALGCSLALHARVYGAPGPSGLTLSAEAVRDAGTPLVKITVKAGE